MGITEIADGLLDVVAEEDPLNDFLDGHPGFEDQLGDPAEDAGHRLRARAVRFAEQAAALPATALGSADRVTRAVVLQQAEALVTRIDSRLVEHTVRDFMVSPIAKLFTALPALRGRQEHYFARLAAIPEFLARSAERHWAGVEAGRLPIAYRVRDAAAHLDSYLANPRSDPLLEVDVQDTHERDRLLADVVRPAFAVYRDELINLAPHGRDEDKLGLCWLPNGEHTYKSLVRMHTTTDRTPEEIHQLGMEVLAELDEQYLEIGSRVFGARTVAEVYECMRTDPAMRYKSEQEVLDIARAAIERAERGAPQWFGRLPAQRCTVAPTPADKAPGASVASYAPSLATYHANTYRWEQRDRYSAEANAFHEGVPGHHFQISLAKELTGLPKLRRVAWINAYLEGWSLYCEQLAEEMGLYSGDVYRLGRLAAASMRAARLVVDTGIHAFGWPRDRVVAFLRAKTLMNEVEVQQETDRYAELPGQALSYLVGKMEFDRIRARAESRLGARFDVRAFHDLVLGGGPLPMAVLDDVVTEWTG